MDYGRTLRPFFDRLQGRRTEPDRAERFYSNRTLVTWLARSLWIFSIISFMALIRAAGNMLTGEDQQSFWPVGIPLVACLVCMSAAYFLSILALRIRARERRLGE